MKSEHGEGDTVIPEEGNEDTSSQVEPEAVKADDVEALKQALAAEKARAETNLAGWQRAQADFINYKRRIEQEREEFLKSANANLVFSLLPILDDLERALNSIPTELCEHGWVEGIKLIGRSLRASLESQGLSPIKALGEPFDPKLHEAVMQSTGKDGIVVSELGRGYMFKDRVLRPSQVIVGNGVEKETESSQGDASV